MMASKIDQEESCYLLKLFNISCMFKLNILIMIYFVIFNGACLDLNPDSRESWSDQIIQMGKGSQAEDPIFEDFAI